MIAFSCAMALIQAQRVLTLVDYSYMIENAYRLYLGQIPYKDFVLMYPIGTFELIALFMKLGGPNEYSILAMQLFCQFLYCIFTYSVLKKICKNPNQCVVLFTIVLLSGHAIATNPNYDILETISALAAINIWITARKNASTIGYLFTGLLTTSSILFKQNVSLVFIILIIILLFVDYLYKHASLKNTLWGIGTIIFCILFLLFLCLHSGFSENILNQLFVYPAGERGPFTVALTAVFAFFKKRNLICAIVALLIYFTINKMTKKSALALTCSSIWIFFLGPACFAYYKYLSGEDIILYSFTTSWYYAIILGLFVIVIDLIRHKYFKEESLILLLIMLYIGANITSMGFTGSTYALYPFMAIMLAVSFECYDYVNITSKFTIPVCILLGLVVLFATNVRMHYIDMSGEINKSVSPKLYGLKAPGDYIPRLENLCSWIKTNVQTDETFVELPGEDPIYYLTDTIPPLPYFHLNSTMFPYDIEKYAQDCIDKKVTYIIIKEDLQCKGFINYQNIKSYICDDYTFVEAISNYQIYKFKTL